MIIITGSMLATMIATETIKNVCIHTSKLPEKTAKGVITLGSGLRYYKQEHPAPKNAKEIANLKRQSYETALKTLAKLHGVDLQKLNKYYWVVEDELFQQIGNSGRYRHTFDITPALVG